MNEDDIFQGCGVEVTLPEKENFLKIVETLTRMGVASRKERKIFQSCHILHKRGRYSIIHFKELFILDGKEDNFSEDDMARRNLIINFLEQWGLVEVVNPELIEDPVAPTSFVKVLKYSEKDDWELIAKYKIGKKTV